MSTVQLDNAAYMAEDWEDETKSKNALKKGFADLGWVQDETLEAKWYLKAGSSFDVDGLLYQVESDEVFYVAKDNIVYIVYPVGTYSNPDMSTGGIGSNISLDIIQEGGVSSQKILKFTVSRGILSSEFTSGVYEGKGFGIYNLDNEIVNLWFDETWPTGTATTYNILNPPSWVSGTDWYSITIQEAAGVSIENYTIAGLLGQKLIQAITGVDNPFSISRTDNVITITTTENGETYEIDGGSAEESGNITTTTIQTGSASQPQISQITVNTGILSTQFTNGIYEGKGFGIYDKEGNKYDLWFDETWPAPGYPAATYNPLNPPSWVGDNYRDITIQEVSGVNITTTNIAQYTEVLLKQIKTITNPTIFVSPSINSYIYYYSSGYGSYRGDVRFNSEKNGFYIPGTNKRCIGYFDGDVILPLKTDIGRQTQLDVIGDVVVDGEIKHPEITYVKSFTWQNNPYVSKTDTNDIYWASNLYILAANSGSATSNIYTSPDGTTWTNRTTASSVIFYTCLYASSLYLIGGVGKIDSSPDGITWTNRASITGTFTGSATSGTGGAGTHVMVGYNSTSPIIYSSTNGTSWTSRTAAGTEELRDVAYFNSKFFAVGDVGTIISSSDGTTWAAETSGSTMDLVSIRPIYLDDTLTLCAVGDSGEILTSLDGATWSKVLLYYDNSIITSNILKVGYVNVDEEYWVCLLSGDYLYLTKDFASSMRYKIETAKAMACDTTNFVLTVVGDSGSYVGVKQLTW